MDEDRRLKDFLDWRDHQANHFFTSVENTVKIIEKLKQYNDNFNNNFYNRRSELLFTLQNVMCKLDAIYSITISYAEKSGEMLLLSKKQILYNIQEQLYLLNTYIEKAEEIYDTMCAFTYKFNIKVLNEIEDMLDDRKDEIFSAAKTQVHNLENAILDVGFKFNRMTAEEITQIFNDMLAHYESDNAQVLENYLSNVIDPKESLRDLNKERDINEILKLWHTTPEPYKFIITLREQGEKDELDLLPVFDYIAKYKRLQEMINPAPTSDDDVVCLPPMLSVKKTKELYLLLRENAFIENSLSEDDFLQLLGIRKSNKVLAPVKWLANKDDLLLLLQGIHSHWCEKGSISQTKLMQIAHARFVSKKGEHYSAQMKMKESYKGKNPIISDFLATL